MRKTLLALILVLALLVTMMLPVTASRRIRAIDTSLIIQGTTAICTVIVCPEKAADSISVVMKLYQQGELIKTWTGSGTGYLYMEREAQVERGCDYQLSVKATINGTAYPLKIDWAPCD